jgi:hypothetical protein
MNLNENFKIYGIPEGISYGQNDRVDEINERRSMRDFSDIPLAPNFDPRPVPTKYAHFPIINRRTPPTERINYAVNHVVELNFSPATQNGPPCGYFNNIDTETMLRNQGVALQHGADQGVYVPSSSSDLYNVSVISRPSNQPFPDLFKKEQLQTSIPQKLSQSEIGKDIFSNHTRTQLRHI